MNPEPSPADENLDENGFPVLDDFLDQLHAGKAPDRARFLQQHPELARDLECLEALDSLSVSAANLTDHPTLAFSDKHEAMEGADRVACAEPDFLSSPVGKEFGNYELIEEIGRGGMGVVFKARQKDLDRLVAVKMIRASLIASAEEVARFQAEARAAAALHHPNVIGVHEIGQVHGQHFFAMTYLPGPSLADLLHQRPLPLEQAAGLLTTVARAVGHLHEHGIVHRDLKPSNILLDEAGQPVVTDFGLVKLVEGGARLTATDAIVGTPSFMAPEQAGGKREDVGPLSDVYSLGAVLYALLTGRPPFAEATALDTLAQVLEGEPPQPRKLNPHIPRALEAICLKCLEKSPAERYPSAVALADDLERFLKGEEVEARGQDIRQRFRRWLRREPALVLRLLALATCAIIAQVRYQLPPPLELELHLETLGLLAVWALLSVALQGWLRHDKEATLPRAVWAGADVLLLTLLLQLLESPESPLMIGYPLLVAASGLWFRVGLVWFTTAACLAGYGWLILSTVWQGHPPTLPHHNGIFALALVLEGAMVAYQVQRVRALSRYYEHRPLP